MTLERFDNYFGGKPHLDTITYRISKDANASNLALQNGEINIKYVDPQDAATIEATGNFEMKNYSEGRLAYMLFNENSDTGLMKNKEVRQGLSYALNREELIQVAYTSPDYADPAKSFVTPDGLYHDNNVTTYDNDVEKAKELLQKNGVVGKTLRFIVTSGNKAQEAIALYVQQKLKDVGVNVEIQSMDASAFSDKFTNPETSDYELTVGGYIMGFDPDAYSILYTTGSDSNYAHYSNPEVDKLFQEGVYEADTAKRGEIYKKLQETIAADAVIYPIAYTKTIVAVDKKFGGLDEAVLKLLM